MPEEHPESRNLLPGQPGAKTPYNDNDNDNVEVEELLPPDHFDRRLSADSKLSDLTVPGKEYHDQSDLDTLRRLSASSLSYGRISPGPAGERPPWYPDQPSLSSRIVTGAQRIYSRNKGVLLVAVSQLFGALMNMSARLLELEGEGMHPFQVLLARQSLTMLCSVIYMWYYSTPGFPFGPKEVRWLLIARGFSGFFGISGMWYSMMYLPLAEATVITFLAPSVAGIACYLAFREPFTRVEQIGTLVAFLGVVFMAHPTALFASSGPSTAAPPEVPGNGTDTSSSDPAIGHEATPAQRLQAIGFALIGVLGAAGAYTTIRWIGKRAHPLISVNYFATWCTLVAGLVLAVAPALDIGQPDLQFALPQGPKQWFLLLFLGAMGFIMQFILTTGLSIDRSNRANAMVFTHMLFAAGFDRWVFGQSMGWMSLMGCGLIIGGALYMVLSKSDAAPRREGADVEAAGGVGVRDTESVPMLMDVDHNESERDELDARRTPLGG